MMLQVSRACRSLGRWVESRLTGDKNTLSWMSACVMSFCHRRGEAFQNHPSVSAKVLSACLSPWRGETSCAGDRWLKCQRWWQADSREEGANLHLSPLSRISDRRHVCIRMHTCCLLCCFLSTRRAQAQHLRKIMKAAKQLTALGNSTAPTSLIKESIASGPHLYMSLRAVWLVRR